MRVDELLDRIGYADSPNFLQGAALAHAGGNGYAFRKAARECGLRGVYTLKPADGSSAGSTAIPLVYVCEAPSSEEARAIHRRVWNQNLVPFLIVRTPRDIRLYSGFRYLPEERHGDPRASGILQPALDFNQAMAQLEGLTAQAIDQGSVWQSWGQEITPRTRVDWRLLDNLKQLGGWLHGEGLSTREANALIGRYVYLRYLRDRGILSNDRLRRWKLDPGKIFGRHATLRAFYDLSDELHEWLNGSVFPLPRSLRGRLTREQLRYVAGTFHGDDPDGQLHLDFQAYDFSFIPIETLSVIYEQFLHAQEERGAHEQGAYYTPISLVDFMLDQMEACRPLEPGMRVLDPACGSGAFLVQCYRRLVEGALRSRPDERLRPTELRELLATSIFGVDIDQDACQVAELSLILILLDYIDPPDLSKTSFKLPALRGRNVFCCDAFDEESAWVRSGRATDHDWVIGNPPWGEFKGKSLRNTHPCLAAWLEARGKQVPIGDNQIAEAFSWRACELAADGGLVGFLLPAMSLFRDKRSFRAALFQRVSLLRVANFANLTEVLFAGRSRVPPAALFYEVPREAPRRQDGDRSHAVLSYAPFLANQEPNRPRDRRRLHTWCIVVDASEIREIPYRDIATGESRPWKLAMWGSAFDQRLLRAVERQYPSLGELEAAGRISISQGLELRSRRAAGEALEPHPELAGQPYLEMATLEGLRHFFDFPEEALKSIAPDRAYIRLRGGRKPLRVCTPPHVIVSAARTFAIFTDRFLVVPPRQVGISAAPAQASFLKALSLYLSSDFARYHQFLSSTQIGIKRPVATLSTLRTLPVAIATATEQELAPWLDLHARLVRATRAAFASAHEPGGLFAAASGHDEDMQPLLDEMNALVNDALQIDRRGRALIHDLVHVKMSLDDGQIGEAAVRAPTRDEIVAYAEMLRAELDAFLSDEEVGHEITLLIDARSGGMIEVALLWSDEITGAVEVLEADDRAARTLRELRVRLLEKRSQWVYFERNLRVYEGKRVFLFKPMKYLHWTRSQALIDAGEIIADTLAGAHAGTWE